MDLERVLRPSSIAVVGASPRTFVGRVALENCRRLGFSGATYPVGRHAEVAGIRGYATFTEISDRVDVALVQVRTNRVLEVVRDGIAAGVGGFIVPGSGFTDSGSAALKLVDDLKRLRAEHDFALIGPNCMGALDLVSGAASYIGTVTEHVRRGTIGLLAQSGAVVEVVVNSGGRVPLSTAISTGSEAITDAAEYLDFFSADPHTTAVIAFIETLTDAPRLTAAIRRITAVGKAVAICVVGHSRIATEGISAHSGRLAVGARLACAAFEQAGAIIASDLEELMAFGEVFGVRRPLPRGPELHVVTNSGGEGNLLADLAEAAGLELPRLSTPASDSLRAKWPTLGVRNPLDPWGADHYELIYPEVARVAAQEPGDILMVAMDQHRASGEHERELGKDLVRYLHAAVVQTDKLPVLLSPVSDDVDPELVGLCRDLDIPLLRGARAGLSVLGKLSRWNTRRAGLRPILCNRTRAVPAIQMSGPLAEDEALDILAELGVRTPRRLMASSPHSVALAAAAFDGAAVVLKGIAVGVTHKTERGLVEINPLDVEDTARSMAARNPDLELSFLVVEHVQGQLEILVGYKRDPIFGATIVLGIGGVWTEYIAELSLHVGALDPRSAEDLLDSSTVGRMMANARGGALDRTGVLSALVAVSDLGHSNPDVRSIEINPLIVGRDHATAVDAVIERR